MEYPTRLLPRSDYKIIVDSSKLKKVYLLHYVEPDVSCKTADAIKDNILKILIPGRFYDGMSCSLFSKIQIDDMKIKVDDPTGQYSEVWNAGDNGIRPRASETHFIGGRKVVSMKMSEVLSFKAKSTIGQGKDLEDVTIRLVPLHAPIKINFWHYNLFLEVIKDSDKSKVDCSKDRTKRLAKAISDDFVSLVHHSSEQQCRYIEKGIYRQ